MINTKTHEFMTKLTALIDGSMLPACNVKLCLDVVRAHVAQIEAQAIAQEAAQAAEQKDK